MNRILLDRGKKAKNEVKVSPDAPALMLVPAPSDSDPAHVIEMAERTAELQSWFRTVAEVLRPRQRSVLALWARGFRRAQLADQLGVSERIVKRELEKIVKRASDSLVARCAAGCDDGTALVCRFAFGIATTDQAAQAQLAADRLPDHLIAAKRAEWTEQRRHRSR